MRPKRKKSRSSGPRRIYTTREIMEITEQRRPKEEAAGVEDDPVLPSLPAKDTSQIIEEVQVIKSKDPIPVNAVMRLLILVFSLVVFFLIVSSKFSESWVNALAAKLNALIVYVSFFVLKIIQGPSTARGTVLNVHYYEVSLQGDLIVIYSLELLIIFATLFAFFQNTTWIKKGIVFISLFPLAMAANILRVMVACGLALNYGPAYADRYFHNVLVAFVFIFILLGLIFFEFLSSSD